MKETTEQIRGRMDKAACELTESLKMWNKKIEILERHVTRCRDVMTSKQKCIVFREQACHDCDDFGCGDNLSKKPSTPKLYKIVESRLKRNETEMIYTVFDWLFNTDNEVLMRCFSEVSDLHSVTLWMTESLATISRLRFSWMNQIKDCAKISSDAICETMGILDSAKIQQATLPERVHMLWERDVTSRALLVDDDSNNKEEV